MWRKKKLKYLESRYDVARWLTVEMLPEIWWCFGYDKVKLLAMTMVMVMVLMLVVVVAPAATMLSESKQARHKCKVK